jgi:hypothetical protein
VAQINLLSSNTVKSNLGQTFLKVAVKVLAGILVALIAYYVFLYFDAKKTDSALTAVQGKIVQAQSSVVAQKDRLELIARQGQIQELQSLLKNHIYWSNLFPKLAEATLKTASYVSFSASNDGTGSMVVSVPSYTELDKFLQVFDLPQFNKNFSDIKIASINRSQKGDVLETRAEIRFKYNGTLIKKSQ